MANINFPTNPTASQVYVFNGTSWTYNGYAWIVNGSIGPQGFQGPQGYNGLDGTTGPQGFNGSNGATGSQGPQGQIGSSGATFGAISLAISGAGGVITTGSKGYINVPYNCTIDSWYIVSSVTGSIVVDVKKSTYATFPNTTSIAGSEPPTLTNQIKNQDLSFTSFQPTITSGDVLEFVVNSASTVTNVNVTLRTIR